MDLRFASVCSRRSRVGFTLVEVLIAASIFTTVSLIAMNVFVNVIRIQKRVSLENAVYEDARVMMERIAREVRENTIDYEEYYNKALKSTNTYGTRYGCYAKRFYNPGSGGDEFEKFGALCSNPALKLVEKPDCVVNKTTLDINTGLNPYAGYSNLAIGEPKSANAFCDNNFAIVNKCAADDPNHNLQTELYLINSKGTEKTFLAGKAISSDGKEHALAMLRLTGQDQDKDGVTEIWKGCDPALAPKNAFCCSTGFACDPSIERLEDTLKYNVNGLYRGYVPISPTRTDVVSLKFLVAPLEDPRKAFAETDTALQIQQQPRVTILLTVQPAKAAMSGFGENPPRVTIQTTVTSRIYGEVKSFYSKIINPNDGVCLEYKP